MNISFHLLLCARIECSLNLFPFSPAGLCPDWDQWDQTKPVDNAREAMQQADDWLGIPQVI